MDADLPKYNKELHTQLKLEILLLHNRQPIQVIKILLQKSIESCLTELISITIVTGYYMWMNLLKLNMT